MKKVTQRDTEIHRGQSLCNSVILCGTMCKKNIINDQLLYDGMVNFGEVK